ncbi:MAG: hypothetical protein Q8M92_09440, partial [Candidatus Subteraquimicrobiales bacterium]|nr:hypothetical protein [Candidatus Subteraquimicrobiales bacterium]
MRDNVLINCTSINFLLINQIKDPTMKNTFLILSCLLLFFALSCQKETTVTNSATKEITTNKIEDMDKHLMDFRARMDNPLKSGELLDLEQA